MTSALGIPVDRRLLGKKAPKHDPRTLRMASYLNPRKLAALPVAKSWTAKCRPVSPEYPFGMMRNDELGDCTCAAIGHQVQVWTANRGTQITIPDHFIVKAYSEFTGYNPNDPATDQGGVELDVLNRWRQDGVNGHRIDGYVALEPHNDMHLRTSIFEFGGAYVGVSLPVTAQTQKVWSYVPNTADNQPGTWGGHAIVLVAYDAHYYWFISWGKLMRMTTAFAHRYIDEAYCPLSIDWYGEKRRAPSGFDLPALQADLAAL